VRRTRSPLASFALASTIASTWLFGGCGRDEPKPRNVVVIVVSALRTDAVGCYGGGVETTAIDGLARDGVRFANAYASAPWAGPSFASILTGLAPSSHGVKRLENVLAPERDTLPEILGEHGYATQAVVSDFLLGTTRGFQQGFTGFGQVLDASRGSSDEVSARGCAFLTESANKDRPFCLLLHFDDPAPPLMPHAEVGRVIRPAGLLKGGETRDALQVACADMTPPEREFLRSLYDGEVRAVDRGVGRVLEKLHDLHLDADTLVIVTATHGYEWMDRGWIGDAHSLHEELVHVPFIARLPGVTPKRKVITDPISVTALTPTVLAMLGIDPGPVKFDCGSLMPILRGDPKRETPVARFEVDFEATAAGVRARSAHAHGVRLGDEKLVRDDRTGALELYDLALDPNEMVNIAQGRPARVKVLGALLNKPVSVRSQP
jgi:arylsulfatase A-like enzyme